MSSYDDRGIQEVKIIRNKIIHETMIMQKVEHTNMKPLFCPTTTTQNLIKNATQLAPTWHLWKISLSPEHSLNFHP